MRSLPISFVGKCLRPATMLCLLLLLSACGSNEPVRARRVPVPPRDVPPVLRGTIGSMATIGGANSILLSGLGFVVGLNGTGGQPLNDEVALTMEREMGLLGIGKSTDLGGTPIDGLSPRQLLQDRNTAVVLVSAVIPAGSPQGSTFDVYVRALNASSLEGGKLWTTDLRLGRASVFGGPQTRKLGEAKGQVFINPFAEPGAETAGVSERVGRVLDGGVVTEQLQITVTLDNPSHGRARQVVSAVNSRFPERPGDDGPIARGKDDAIIQVTLPFSYRDRPADFMRLLATMRLDQSSPQVYARGYAGALRRDAYLASDLTWALQALGEPALPFLRDLYDDPELVPRLAALRAGAGLGDPRVAPHLKELATDANTDTRVDAIRLLARIDGGPTIDELLRDQLDEPLLTVRIAAYEALAERAERAYVQQLIELEMTTTRPMSERPTLREIKRHAERRLPPGSIQGVVRRPIEDKFLLDRVPSGDPLVYITQSGTPRIVIFGENPTLRKPLFLSAWSDRLMLIGESEGDPLRMYYRPLEGEAIQLDVAKYVPAYRGEVEEDLIGLIEFFARRWSPEDQRAGLDFTYSETVGALYELYKAGATDAAFATEQDRLLAEILEAGEAQQIEVRPETPGDEPDVLLFDPIGPQRRDRAPQDLEPGDLLEPIPGKVGSQAGSKK